MLLQRDCFHVCTRAQHRGTGAPESLDSTILEQPVDEEEENVVENLGKAVSIVLSPRLASF
jgi:hypothetical protein